MRLNFCSKRFLHFQEEINEQPLQGFEASDEEKAEEDEEEEEEEEEEEDDTEDTDDEEEEEKKYKRRVKLLKAYGKKNTVLLDR